MKNTLSIILLCLVSSCKVDSAIKPDTFTYGTDSQQAMCLYNRGWQEIMDNGRYAAAEHYYRNAIEKDSNFLIAYGVLGRLTLNLDERLKILKRLEETKNTLKGDERLLLDVYTAFVDFTNQRELYPQKSKMTLDSVLVLAEKNLKHLVHRYPAEIYLKAEYIEILHALYGPTIAIDSLYHLTDNKQKDNPFLLGYDAEMHAELGEFEIALSKANRLLKIQNDTTLPKPYAVFASIYVAMDSLEIAKDAAEKATRLDKRNLDASRLLTKIEGLMSIKKTKNELIE